MRTTILTLALLIAALSAAARSIYQCEEDGKIMFSDRPCASAQAHESVREYDTRPTGIGGSNVMEQNREMLDSYERRRERIYRDRNRERDRYLSRNLGYKDRLRIRELEMQKRELQRDLDRVDSRGVGNWGKANTIGSQIRGIDRQIQDIRAYPSGH